MTNRSGPRDEIGVHGLAAVPMEPELLADHFESLAPEKLAVVWVSAVVDQFSRWGLVEIGDGTTGQLARALLVVNRRLHRVEWKGLDAEGIATVSGVVGMKGDGRPGGGMNTRERPRVSASMEDRRMRNARVEAMMERVQQGGSAFGIGARGGTVPGASSGLLGDGIQLVVDVAPPEQLKTKHPKLAEAIEKLLKAPGSQAHLKLDAGKYSRRVVGIVISAMSRHQLNSGGKPLGLKTWVSGSHVIVAKDSNVKEPTA